MFDFEVVDVREFNELEEECLVLFSFELEFVDVREFNELVEERLIILFSLINMSYHFHIILDIIFSFIVAIVFLSG